MVDKADDLDYGLSNHHHEDEEMAEADNNAVEEEMAFKAEYLNPFMLTEVGNKVVKERMAAKGKYPILLPTALSIWLIYTEKM